MTGTRFGAFGAIRGVWTSVGRGRQQPQDQAAQQEGRKDPEPQPDQGPRRAANDKPVDRSEAQRLLDALRASEKNLEIWRFAKKGEAKKRSVPDKDW